MLQLHDVSNTAQRTLKQALHHSHCKCQQCSLLHAVVWHTSAGYAAAEQVHIAAMTSY